MRERISIQNGNPKMKVPRTYPACTVVRHFEGMGAISTYTCREVPRVFARKVERVKGLQAVYRKRECPYTF